MTQITAEHLERSAIVYVRQSTAYQVTNNVESGRRQYGLAERARQLGWSDVQIINDDLSMATSSHAAICWQLTHIVRSGLWFLMSGTTRHAPDTRHDAHRRAVLGSSSSVRS